MVEISPAALPLSAKNFYFKVGDKAWLKDSFFQYSIESGSLQRKRSKHINVARIKCLIQVADKHYVLESDEEGETRFFIYSHL